METKIVEVDYVQLVDDFYFGCYHVWVWDIDYVEVPGDFPGEKCIVYIGVDYFPAYVTVTEDLEPLVEKREHYKVLDY